MTDEEKAKERFVAHGGVNLGKAQCISCAYFDLTNFFCLKLSRKEAAKYMSNNELCPFRLNGSDLV